MTHLTNSERVLGRTLLAVLLAMVFAITGCRPGPDDVRGQAGELSDPVRRAAAIGNITRVFRVKLEEASGNLSAPQVQAVINDSVEALSSTYVNNSADTRGGQAILDLLSEMRDPRSLPALTRALEWRTEVTERHAILAARTLVNVTIPDAQKGPVVEAIGRALERVNSARGLDNEMRREFIRALGALGDRRATPHLVRVLTTRSESQPFLVNVIAADQLGRLRDPAAIPALIQGLFLIDRSGMRTNASAARALTRLGTQAVEPLLATLRGQNQDISASADALVAMMRERGMPESLASREVVVSLEVCQTLGQLGAPSALPALLTEMGQTGTGEGVLERVMVASASAVRVARSEADVASVRAAIPAAFERLDERRKMQLLAAVQRSFDVGLLPFFLSVASNRSFDPMLRGIAYKAYAMLANGSEVTALTALRASEPEGDAKDNFLLVDTAIEAIGRCNADRACWSGQLGATDDSVAIKAAYMVARLGRGDASAIQALADQFAARAAAPQVRGELLSAIDFAAPQGSAYASQKIAEARQREEGQRSWALVESLAEEIDARLASRVP